MFIPVDTDLVVGVVDLSIDRIAGIAGDNDFAVGACAHRAAHREVEVAVGQLSQTRIDRADAVLVLAELAEVSVLTLVGTDDGVVLAILSDQEADDVGGRSDDFAVGLTFTFSLDEVDDARLLRVVGDHQDVVLANFRIVIVDGTVARVVLMLTLRIAEVAVLSVRGAVAAVHDLVASEVRASIARGDFLLGVGTPHAEVDVSVSAVVRVVAFHVDDERTTRVYSHVVERRIVREADAAVVHTFFSSRVAGVGSFELIHVGGAERQRVDALVVLDSGVAEGDIHGDGEEVLRTNAVLPVVQAIHDVVLAQQREAVFGLVVESLELVHEVVHVEGGSEDELAIVAFSHQSEAAVIDEVVEHEGSEVNIVESEEVQHDAVFGILAVELTTASETEVTASVGVQGDVVNVEDELVGAVEVTDGHITGLALVGAQVGSEQIPVALCTVGARTTSADHAVNALGSQCPLLDGGEVRTRSTSGRDSHAEVFGSVVGVLSASIEAERTTEGHFR